MNKKEDWSDLEFYLGPQEISKNVWSLPTMVPADSQTIDDLNNGKYVEFSKDED